MQEYEFACRKRDGDYLARTLGTFPSLLEALESVALELPLPEDCQHWAIISADGLEMAAKRD